MTHPLIAAEATPRPSIPVKANALLAVAHRLVDHLRTGNPLARRDLTALMTAQFGQSDAAGIWSMRDAYDALEVAQVLLLSDPDIALVDDADTPVTLRSLQEFARLLPTQTYRSERQVDFQIFSTPLPLAWLAAHAARMTAADVVLEPSAGTGMLAVHARRIGASLILNERDPLRAALLAEALGCQVTRHDGACIDDLLPPDVRPSVVLINPPFSRSENLGRDRHAGGRHLRSALARLAPGGRCIALMPPGFAPDGSGASGYDAVAKLVPPRLEINLIGNPFGAHGTSIAVRLILFDKGWAGELQRTTARDLGALSWILLDAPLRLAPVQPQPCAPISAVSRPSLLATRPARAGGLLGRINAPALALPARPGAISGEAEPLVYRVIATPAPVRDPVGIYMPWRLARMEFPCARPHPDQLVESIAMASIVPPPPTYRPMLPRRAVDALSDAQLETIIYAGQAFARDLPGLHAANAAGTLLEANADGQSYRMGYFIGDGTGVGKGQQVAAIMLDRWCRGQRRAVWISKSAALIEDARRDWSALGGAPIDIQPLDTFAFGAPITMDSGILFLTYATLRSQRHDSASRLQQLLAWLGETFDGVIAFDEAHELSNAAGTETVFGTQKGSEQGLAGVRLQNLLPRACVLYISATGATDPANLCYASRLGLWGQGTAFETRTAFMAAIASGGIAAMEIVARDLKALGVYTARALSFEGVDYQPLEHRLTDAQIAVYDIFADSWAIIHEHLDVVLEATNIVDRMNNRALNAMAKGSALSVFESAKQRFFNQVLIASKLATLIPEIEAAVISGHHVVVQLVTTAEAMLERRLASLDADERAELDIELSPTAAMIEYLRTAFPTRMMKVFKGGDGQPRSEPMVDEEGNPVHCQEAIRIRDSLIETLCAMPAIPSALDELIRHFGTQSIAEVTGRTRRLVVDSCGRQKIERRGARSNIAEASAFMNGDKAILVFSDAGGTGRSYHADRNCKSAGRRRMHFLLEPGWRAAAAIQGLGRTNRTNQASAPIFRPVTTDCRGERRFISTIARRLDSLGALTRGQRQTGGQNLFDPADNLESEHAREALVTWYHLLYRGKLKSTTLAGFVAMTGLRLIDAESGSLLDTLPPIQRFLNRLLALRIATQNAIFDEYLALIQARIDAAREAGTLDVGVETILADRVVLLDEQILRRDAATGAETRLCRLELHRRRRPLSFARLMARHADVTGLAFLHNARSGRVALRVPSSPIMDSEGCAIPVWLLIRPGARDRVRETAMAESFWEPIDEVRFRGAWETECDDIAHHVDIETINVATGVLLPVWNRLPDDDVRVWRIADGAGQAILGRIVSPAGFEKLSETFGVTMAIALSPAELISAATAHDGIAIPGLEPARLKRVRVNDALRLEIRNFPQEKREWLKSLGCFTEIIAYKTRLFMPPDRAEAILAAIMAANNDGIAG